ncbi:unnamed protein product [Lymnaea stagnalis]|uniref:CBM21 domain-containing protein n=1 Tax=Lymnaea stagnalis TaxID=6523 RepID=A0AAV2HNQ8_LYMST
MYFCPCACNDPIDPETEENTFVTLPRNLSYVQESYLDRYSVSARYVYNPKIDRLNQHEQSQESRFDVEEETIGLLSVIRAQDFSANCSGSNCIDVFNPSHSPDGTPDRTRPESPTFHGAFSIYASGLTKATGASPSVCAASSPLLSPSSLLAPASRVASKLTTLLRSPPNESMSAVRESGSSVDGDGVSQLSEALSRVELQCPDSLGQDMDRGFAVNEKHKKEEYSSFCDSPDLDNMGPPDSDANDQDSSHRDQHHVGPAGMTTAPDAQRPYGYGTKTVFPKRHSDDDVTIGSPQPGTSTRDDVIDASVPYGSPDSDGFSEEGVFVNMDDLDTADKSTTLSEVSDDTCVSVDSMFLSPEEGDLEEETKQEPARKMTLQEAINRAASDLHKIAQDLYGEDNAASSASSRSLDSKDSDDEDLVKFSKLSRAGRASPIRIGCSLKLQITDSQGEDVPQVTSATDLSESPLYSESEFNFNRINLRKSSSLKTNKTPPGTPHRKKVVRFADAMGLDLESVRHVLNMESPPKIPASAMADLKDGLGEERKEIGSKYLCACFNQPGAADNFFQKVISQKVCLENAIITDLTITGFVRVSNISFQKSVRVRYTHNAWATFHDIAASYVQNSCDGPTDRFSFSIVAPPFFGLGSRLEFAVSYNAGGTEYWDSNDGNNYVFECFAKTFPTDNETAWLHFL